MVANVVETSSKTVLGSMDIVDLVKELKRMQKKVDTLVDQNRRLNIELNEEKKSKVYWDEEETG